MGSPSVSTHRGLVHWQGLLLVVSLLNFWNQPTTAQMRIDSISALEGKTVTLHVHDKPRNAEQFLWFRGGTIDSYNNIAYLLVNRGSYVRGPPVGQVTVNDDGSLLLRNVTVEDSGIYTLLVHLQGCQKMIACGQLEVYPHVSVPTLLASSTMVPENRGAVVFTCQTKEHGVEWFFNNRSLMFTERVKLSLDYRNLTIEPVLRWDAGDYKCKASNPKSSAESAQLKLDVKFE